VPAPPAGVKVALLAAVLLNCAFEVEGPLNTLHAPTPLVGTFAASVVLPAVVQMVWSGPALEVVVPGIEVITTSSLLAVQGLLLIVQRKV
jgi:hypothetical protein